jgi:hypothetical protein
MTWTVPGAEDPAESRQKWGVKQQWDTVGYVAASLGKPYIKSSLNIHTYIHYIHMYIYILEYNII